jgi:NTE family protein
LRRLERRRVPTLPRILYRTLLLSSEAQRRRNQTLADLYLTPPVDAFDLFDWKAMDRIVEAGYRYATERLAEWLPGQQAKGRVSQIQQSVGAARPRQPS